MSLPAIQFARHIAQFHIQFYGRTVRTPIYFMGLLNPLKMPRSFLLLLSGLLRGGGSSSGGSYSTVRGGRYPVVPAIYAPIANGEIILWRRGSMQSGSIPLGERRMNDEEERRVTEKNRSLDTESASPPPPPPLC